MKRWLCCRSRHYCRFSTTIFTPVLRERRWNRKRTNSSPKRHATFWISLTGETNLPASRYVGLSFRFLGLFSRPFITKTPSKRRGQEMDPADANADIHGVRKQFSL